MLLVKTAIRPSTIHGLGLFALEPISKGARIWRFVPGFDHFTEDAASFPAHVRAYLDEHCGLLESGEYLQSGDRADFMNHSANPNTYPCALLDDVIASKDISAGEEITINYRAFDKREDDLH